MIDKSFAAGLAIAALLAMHEARAESTERMNYNDGLFCQAIYLVSMDAEDFQQHPHAELYSHFETYRAHARKAALELGGKEGKSADDIETALDDAEHEMRGSALDGELTFEKLGTFGIVCDKLIDAYRQ
jgi:hypothetical protein